MAWIVVFFSLMCWFFLWDVINAHLAMIYSLNKPKWSALYIALRWCNSTKEMKTKKFSWIRQMKKHPFDCQCRWCAIVTRQMSWLVSDSGAKTLVYCVNEWAKAHMSPTLLTPYVPGGPKKAKVAQWSPEGICPLFLVTGKGLSTRTLTDHNFGNDMP